MRRCGLSGVMCVALWMLSAGCGEEALDPTAGAVVDDGSVDEDPAPDAAEADRGRPPADAEAPDTPPADADLGDLDAGSVDPDAEPIEPDAMAEPPPTTPVARVTPTDGAPGAAPLACEIAEPAVDPAGGLVEYTVEWSLDGRLVRSGPIAEGEADVVSAAETRAGTWRCAITARAEQRESTPGVAEAVLIGPWCGAAEYAGPPPPGDWWVPGPRLEHDLPDGDPTDWAAQAMAMTDAEILANVPLQTPRIHHCCPDVVVGLDDPPDRCFASQPVTQVPRYRFDPLQPDRVSCQAGNGVPESQAWFPDNPDYPADQVDLIEGPDGRVHEVPYFYDEAADRKYYLHGMLYTARHLWLSVQMVQLAQRYRMTGEAEAGRKAMLIADAYTDVWPDWPYTDNYGQRYRSVCEGGNCQNFSPCVRSEMTREGRRQGDKVDGPRLYLDTLDLMNGTQAMTDYAIENGIDDFMAKTRQNVFGPLRVKCGEPTASLVGRTLSQTLPGANSVDRSAVIGFVDDLRISAAQFEQTPEFMFFADGGYPEGTGYTQIQLQDLEDLRILNGYSDPPGHVPADGGPPLVDFRYPTGPAAEFYRRAFTHLDRLAMPSGGVPIVGETGHAPFTRFGPAGPRARSTPFVMPALKHALLGDGEGDAQVQLHLNYGPGGPHNQTDTLNLQLFAFGHYLIDDHTYWRDRLASYSNTTVSHNTGLFDTYNQIGGLNEGDPVLVETTLPGLQALAVEARRAYPGLARRYRRTVLLSTAEIDRPYVIDVMHMAGGFRMRDYLMRATDLHDTTVTSSLEWAAVPGDRPLMDPRAEYVEPESQNQGIPAYANFFAVQRAEPREPFWINFEVVDPWDPARRVEGDLLPYIADPATYADEPAVGVRHHVVPPADGLTAYLFESSSNPPDHEADLPIIEWSRRLGHFMLRHANDDHGGDEAVFVVVHEPYLGAPSIDRVERLDAGPDAVALAITFADGRRDVAVVSLTDDAVEAQVGGLDFAGRVGLRTVAADGDHDGYLIGGTRLLADAPALELRQDVSGWQGRVVATHRRAEGDAFDGFTLDGDALPDGYALGGQHLRVQAVGAIDLEVETCAACASYNEQVAKYFGRTIQFAERDPDNVVLQEDARRARGIIDNAAGLGAGWAFEIERVERVDDQLRIHLSGDHGLRLADDRLQEVFRPGRQVVDAIVEWRVDSRAATQGMPRLDPPAGPLSGPVTVTCQTDAVGGEVEVAAVPDDWARDPRAMHGSGFAGARLDPYGPDGRPADWRGLVWQPCADGVAIDGDRRLLARSVTATGVAEARPVEASYTAPVTAPPLACAAVEPGLLRQDAAGDLRRPPVAATHIDTAPLIAELVRAGEPAEVHLRALLKVDRDGPYTLHLLAPDTSRLAVGDAVLKPAGAGYLGHLVPHPMRVWLSAGLHPVEIISPLTDPLDEVHLAWEGPTHALRAVSETDLFRPADGSLAPFNAAPTITPPARYALPVGVPAPLGVQVNDDGRPTGALSISWQADDAAVRFIDPSATETDIAIDAPGVYRLTLTADDGLAAHTLAVGVEAAAPYDGFERQGEALDDQLGAEVLTGVDGTTGPGLVTLDGAGAFAEWQVEVPDAGRWQLHARRGANGHTGITLTVGDIERNMALLNTGSPLRIGEQTLGEPLELNAGPLTVRIAVRDDRPVAIDRLRFERVE